MKNTKTLIALLTGALLSTAAYAQVEVTVTGSTAFRAITIDRSASLFDVGSLTAVTNDDPDKGGLLRLLNVDIGLILHGEQHYDYYAPVYVGDTITCQQKVTDL